MFFLSLQWPRIQFHRRKVHVLACVSRVRHQAVPARSGPEGIELAGRIQPALIILDIQLPQMDGYTVARELRQNAALKDVPIVAVTSYAMVGDRERALEAGCNGYIEKPINPDTFRSQIEMYLKARPAGGETQP